MLPACLMSGTPDYSDLQEPVMCPATAYFAGRSYFQFEGRTDVKDVPKRPFGLSVIDFAIIGGHDGISVRRSASWEPSSTTVCVLMPPRHERPVLTNVCMIRSVLQKTADLRYVLKGHSMSILARCDLLAKGSLWWCGHSKRRSRT